jgi:phosphate transport system substrate-binding protein
LGKRFKPSMPTWEEQNMPRTSRILVVPFFFILIQALCMTFPSRPFAADVIRINGCGTGLDMMKPLTEAYVGTSRNVSIKMEKPLGSSGAIKALLAGILDLAVSCRPVKPEEAARGAKPRPFGKTPLVIVTDKRVSLKNVTTRELEDIYAGRTTKWPNGETVRIILRPNEETDTKILKGISPGMADAVDSAHRRPGMMIAVTDPESSEAISRTIGSVGASTLTGVLVGRLPMNVVAFNGVVPSRKTLADGTYPLAKEIGFVTTGELPSAAAKFLQFVYSRKGRAIAEKFGVLITAAEGK